MAKILGRKHVGETEAENEGIVLKVCYSIKMKLTPV